jgi:eukaryotic-like serine/threonine-protein kinase
LLAIAGSGTLALALERRVAGFVRTGTLARVPLTGSEPRRLMDDILYADWTAPGERLIVVRRVAARCRLEWPAGRVVYETDGLISHPRVSRDGALVAFVDHPHYSDDGGSVVVCDADGSRTVLSEGWSSVWGLAWAPDTEEVWFTAARAAGARALQAVTLSGSERLLSPTMTALTLHDVSASGDVLVSHDVFRSAALFRGTDETVECDLSYLDTTFPRDLSRDGSTLLFDETGEGGGPDYSVYVRATAGGPPIKLGNGLARTLSPDGRWATSLDRAMNRGITVLPTGVGQSYTIRHADFDEYRTADWLPDGRQIVFSAGHRGSRMQMFVHDVVTNKARRISIEGFIGPAAIAPDGGMVVGINTEDRSSWLFHVDPGPPATHLAGVLPTDLVIQWSSDGEALYVRRTGGELPLRVHRVDLRTGEKVLLKEVSISDRAGVEVIAQILLTPDARNYVLTYARVLSDLFIMTGVG